MRVDLRTGALLAYMPRISGSVAGRPEAYCHHGGGLARTPDGLWVLKTKRLWLLDPHLVKTGRDPVVKVWFIEKPLRGSVLVTAGEELGVGEFREDRHGDIHWFRYEDIEAPGVTTLVRHGARRTARQVPARRVIPAPRYLQGAATVPAHSAAGNSTASGTWFVSSNTRCGVLHRPKRQPRRLWSRLRRDRHRPSGRRLGGDGSRCARLPTPRWPPDGAASRTFRWKPVVPWGRRFLQLVSGAEPRPSRETDAPQMAASRRSVNPAAPHQLRLGGRRSADSGQPGTRPHGSTRSPHTATATSSPSGRANGSGGRAPSSPPIQAVPTAVRLVGLEDLAGRALACGVCGSREQRGRGVRFRRRLVG
jgi:hypothetical protein